MRIATWNINSVRLRKKNILNFLKDKNIDIICLQETKTVDKDFPVDDFIQCGYLHNYFRGEKSYNGVAILSKLPIKKKEIINWCNKNDTRHLSVSLLQNITLHNFYVPAGGDIPDKKINLKFKHKLDFLQEMIKYFKADKSTNKIILGDFNVAPGVEDVWSHKQLIRVVSHTEIETKMFNELLKFGSLLDIIRLKNNKLDKLFSWWSYRNKDWRKSNRGRRLDHILISKELEPKVKKVHLYSEYRDMKNPSDHIPVVIEI